MQGIREVVWTSQRARGKVQSRLSIFYPLVVYSAFSGMFFFFSSLFVLKFWAAELTLGLFFSHDFEGSRQKGGLWSFSPKSYSLPLQTWVWLRLRYRAALTSTVVMKLTGCFDLSAGRPTHTHIPLWNVLQMWNDQSSMPIKWIRTDLEIANLHWAPAPVLAASVISAFLDFKH